ncbi:MAG: hypothetical protein IJW55_02135 [Clostridia bacterium]|nr:hypothetical protein [Clostridia bacterium]
MKLHNRILSTLLAVILLLGSMVIGVSAAETTTDTSKDEKNADEVIQSTYVGTVYRTPEDKLESMKLMLTRDGFELYVDAVSGEVATREIATNNILFSNPYDVASSTGSDSTKKQILSQLVVQYVDNGTTKYLYSFEEAAMRQQITVLNIKNGVRVEYTIGREESRKLVPRWISDTSFVKYIQTPLKEAVEKGEIQEFFYNKFMTYYKDQRLADKTSKKAKEQLLQAYPICEEMDIWVFATDASSVEINWCEAYIKAYCEDYTFEQMDADHDETGYEATDEQYPLFKMALEYSLDASGLNVTLPCNGLRYDMSTYTLENISILPYMGAGNSKNAGLTDAEGNKYAGYNFYPDGSGSLFDFEQLNTKSTTTVRGKVYGIDYAYHQITGTYQKTIRYPVYGTVATEKIYTVNFTSELVLDKETMEIQKGTDGKTMTGDLTPYEFRVSNTVMDLEAIEKYVTEDLKGTLTYSLSEIEKNAEIYERGYVAVIESGESLAEIATYHAGSLSDYNTMMNYFNPKPKDSYDISDSISVTSSSTWTVVSERKYTGNITIHYQMLTDENVGKAEQAENASYTYYDTTWLGMAEAYRDYLIDEGKLTKLTEETTEDNIPLYLEVFGALETTQQIMTIPVDVMTPLTTFENVYQMYDALSDQGVKNINFKLTGFANGGMYSTVPAKLKWEKAVGGSDGFETLISQAADVNAGGEEHLGLYPDFDFAYINVNTLFDSTSLKKDAIKTIDNRYSSLRQYSATQQAYVSFYQLAISPSRYSKFYEKLLKNYEKYGLTTMSVGSLGTTLNSDFDEDDPYNREDGKDYTVQAFQDLQAAGYSLMSEGANAYSWGYLDHMINVDLDSSRYIKSSASVPFIGAVLHGYIQFAGTAFNEEGDTNYAILRALENGAGLYFILSYQNTNELKEDPLLSQYYSVRYDIWEKDVVSYYNELNALLKDVQTKVIVNHQFLVGQRVLDRDELEEELMAKLEQAAAAEEQKQKDNETEKVLSVANAWQTAENATANVKKFLAEMEEINKDIYAVDADGYESGDYANLILQITFLSQELTDAVEALYPHMDDHGENFDALEPKDAVKDLQTVLNTIRSLASGILKQYNQLVALKAEGDALIAELDNAKAVVEASDIDADTKTKMMAKIDAYKKSAQEEFASAEQELQKNSSLVTEGSDDYVVTKAMTALEELLALMNDTESESYEDYQLLLQVLTDNNAIFTAEGIIAAGQLDTETEDTEGDTDADVVYDKHRVDNNQIVVVTYGDRDDTTHAKTYVKSFILNYNNFSVIVDYEDPTTGVVTTYTIPSGGYVVIEH